MFRLHGIWHNSQLLVWGEELDATGSEISHPAAMHDAAPGGSGTAVLPSRTGTGATIKAHPFALPTDGLHAALGEITPDGLLASIAEEKRVRLCLPAREEWPLPSVPARHAHGEIADFERTTFELEALAFGPADSIDLLTSMSSRPSPAIGPSLRFWQLLARYGLSALGRQQFAPTVEQVEPSRFEGRWRVLVCDAAELKWIERMAAMMPPICHLAIADNGKPDTQARLVDSFLTASCEAVIRRCLEGDEFYRDFHERAQHERKWEVRWISSLVGDRRSHAWPDEDPAELAGQIRAWAAPIAVTDGEEMPELSFTLLEPRIETHDEVEHEIEPWRVRFEMKSGANDDSLDIRQLWLEGEQTASILGQHLSARASHLRAELNRAAAVFPQLRGVLNSDEWRDVTLSLAEAHEFIRERAPLLVSEGFDVALPEWAQTRQRRLGLELVVRPRDERGSEGELSLGSFGLHSMMDFDWRVAVGDERMTPEEFEAVVQSRAPLVRLRGQWIDLDAVAFDKARAFMQRHAGGALTLAQAVRLSAGIEEEDTGLPIVGLVGTSWLERLLNESSHVELERLEQPEDFNGTMRPYQVRGLDWLAFLNRLGIGACLADDMGLGKTIQLIALLLYERRQNPQVGPTLLFVPMSVVGNWQRELHKFARPLRTLVHHGPDRLAGDAFIETAEKHHVVITTYGLAHRDLELFSRVRWNRIAMDEAQKIKNPSANQSVAIRSLKATHRVALTGTPLENHLSELWSIIEALNPGLLGSAASFRKQFAIPIEKMGDQKRAEQLRRMIRPFVLRRLKGDPNVQCDLPEKLEMRIFCNLTTEQAALYKETVRQMLDEIDQASGIRRRGLILATLTKLKQICNHPAHFHQDDSSLEGRSGKCERIVEMLEEVLEEGDAALIFTQYRVMGDLLERMIEERLRTEVLFLHGGTPAKRRDEMVDEFQNPDGKKRLFLLSLKAGGFGLNLTRANHVFHFDRWWNPAVEQQATDRAHRIGQTRRVQVYKFVSIGTIEDRIDKLLTEKAALADHIVGSGDEWLTNLSTGELKEYLALSLDAVAEE
ncbi:MAG TPA: DEAD/DEAH box helicase [Phycisphaerae bacterium]|nr:DEAD/DEAH box helicase [Phycisphaerae bacterium]